jgi:hypothetical protein
MLIHATEYKTSRDYSKNWMKKKHHANWKIQWKSKMTSVLWRKKNSGIGQSYNMHLEHVDICPLIIVNFCRFLAVFQNYSDWLTEMCAFECVDFSDDTPTNLRISGKRSFACQGVVTGFHKMTTHLLPLDIAPTLSKSRICSPWISHLHYLNLASAPLGYRTCTI